MKLGVTQWTLDVQGVATVARAAELGLSALQLDAGGWSGWPEKLDENNLDDYRKAAAETGIELVGIGVNPTNDFSLIADSGSSSLMQAKDAITSAIDAAKYLDISLVYVPSFNASEMKSDEHIRRTAAVLADLAEQAHKAGVLLASENTLDVEQQLRLLEYADHTNLKIFIDTQNPVLWGHSVAEIIRGLEQYICPQIHLKDGRDGQMGNSSLGEGQARFSETAQVLKELNINALLVFENEYGEDAEARMSKDKNTVLEAFT